MQIKRDMPFPRWKLTRNRAGYSESWLAKAMGIGQDETIGKAGTQEEFRSDFSCVPAFLISFSLWLFLLPPLLIVVFIAIKVVVVLEWAAAEHAAHHVHHRRI